MTKTEIRILSLAKLRLFPGAVVYDVGAGSGSVSIETKLLFPDSQVFAIERDPEALHLIQANQAKFRVDLEVVAGEAPMALVGLPQADRIFIGGSGGNLTEILRVSDQQLKSGGWMVLNTVTLHNTAQAFDGLEAMGYRTDAIQINIAVSSQRGPNVMWQARNPVTIISGLKGDISSGTR